MTLMEQLRSTSPQVILDAYAQTQTIAGVGKLLNISTKSSLVRNYIHQVLVDNGLHQKQQRSRYSIDDIRDAVGRSICMSDVLKQLGLTIHGSNAKVIKRLMVEHNIDYGHFNQSAALAKNNDRVWTFDEVFVERSPVPRSTLSRHVKRFGVLGDPMCALCKITDTYNGKPINLNVDHINGISDDNRVENLRWLCPNCHSQTDTYGGKNKQYM